jgi:2-polyprenyl-3-methyl-5-hydroxy-6-metoxy-1,4-benzoquinol methylase
MNKQPIEQAKDRDLRLSLAALQRAAQRARDVAAATGTALVISCNGVIEHVAPKTPTSQKSAD